MRELEHKFLVLIHAAAWKRFCLQSSRARYGGALLAVAGALTATSKSYSESHLIHVDIKIWNVKVAAHVGTHRRLATHHTENLL